MKCNCPFNNITYPEQIREPGVARCRRRAERNRRYRIEGCRPRLHAARAADQCAVDRLSVQGQPAGSEAARRYRKVAIVTHVARDGGKVTSADVAGLTV